MKKWMYRGQQAIKQDGHVIKFGDVVDGDHDAIVKGWNGFVPVRASEESLPETVEEIEVVEVDDEEYGDYLMES